MSSSQVPAGIGSRLLAILYDVLIVFFITIVITLIVQQTIIQFELVPLEQIQIDTDQYIPTIPAESFANTILKSFWTLIGLFYFAYHWTKTGQTLGMRVWKVKAIRNDDSLMGWKNAIYRYVFALFGFGLFWIIIDKQNLALQDKLSQTHLISLKNIRGNV